MSDCSVFDDTLLSILKECNTLPNFLNVVFGFLNRRTDFYCLATKPNSSIGLPEGWAEYYVKQAFFKWKCNDTNEKYVIDKNDEVVIDANEMLVNPNEEIVIDTNEDLLIYTDEEIVSTTKPEKGICNNTIKQPENFSASESYNGATFDNYTWSQTINDINVIVKLPEDVVCKDLYVSILPQKISIKIKKSNYSLLEGVLCQKIKHNDAIWSVDKHKLDLHLDKSSEMWWNCLVTSEPTLDITKIDCSRPFEELSEEAQAKIEELTWNQERKRLGLPTSSQLNLHEKLSKAIEAEDSPFKGIDPNTIILN